MSKNTDYLKLWRKEKANNVHLTNRLVLAMQAVEEAKKEINRLRLKSGEQMIDWKTGKEMVNPKIIRK